MWSQEFAYVLYKLTVWFCFFFNDTATTEIYTLSLHDALPISNGGHDLDVRRDFAGGQGDQHRGVVPAGGDDDRRRVLNGRQTQHIGPGGVAGHGDQTGVRCVVERGLVGVDDNDVLAGGLVIEDRGDGGFPLGAVADHDGVVTHSAPPTLNLPRLPRPFGEHLKRRANQHDDEQDPQRGDDQDVGQPRGFRVRGDVAVAGGGQRHRREVQTVQERHSTGADVYVPVAGDVDGDHREQQRKQRDQDPPPDGANRADMDIRDAQHADQRIRGQRGQRLVEIASPPTSFGHNSSARPGARHNVTMTA